MKTTILDDSCCADLSTSPVNGVCAYRMVPLYESITI